MHYGTIIEHLPILDKWRKLTQFINNPPANYRVECRVEPDEGAYLYFEYDDGDDIGEVREVIFADDVGVGHIDAQACVLRELTRLQGALEEAGMTFDAAAAL